jgi:hypothetical protein
MEMNRVRVSVVAMMVVVSLAGWAVPQTVHAQSDGSSSSSESSVDGVPADKEKLIRELIEISEMTRMGEQVMNRMFKMMKKQHPEISDSHWKKLRQGMDMKELVDKLVPIFDKYYTKTDIKKLIEFYESDVGQKLIRVQPKITKEAMRVGRRWGRNAAKEVMQQVKEKKQSESGGDSSSE